MAKTKTNKSNCLKIRKNGLFKNKRRKSARTEQNAFVNVCGFLKVCCPIRYRYQTNNSKPLWKKTMLTDFTRRILDGLTAQNAAAAALQTAGTAARGFSPIESNPGFVAP